MFIQLAERQKKHSEVISYLFYALNTLNFLNVVKHCYGNDQKLLVTQNKIGLSEYSLYCWFSSAFFYSSLVPSLCNQHSLKAYKIA